MGRDGLLALACAGCHAASPAAPAAPVADTGLAWKLRDARLATAGRAVAVVVSNDLRFVDPRDGFQFAAAWTPEPERVLATGDQVIVLDGYQRRLVAIRRPRTTDVRIEPQWIVKLGDDDPLALGADARRVYLATGRDASSHDELAAFDVATGAFAWRRALPDGWRALRIHAGGVVICSRGRDVAIGESIDDEVWPDAVLVLHLDPGTGAQTWRYQTDRAFAAMADADHAVVARDGALTILDGNGAPSELAYPHRAVRRIAIADGVAYVAGVIGNAGVVEAIGLADRKILWSHREARAPNRLAIGDHAIYVVSEGAILRGLDRTTGDVRWEWGLPDADISLAADGDRLYVGAYNMGVFAFAPGTSPPLEDAEVRGRVLPCDGDPRGTVSIGDVETPVAADGRFAARVRARGWLQIAATHAFSTEIRLVGHGTYDAGVLVPRCPKK